MRVVFPNGQVFPIRHYLTTDVFSVDLPAGTYEAEELSGLRKILKAEFNDVTVLCK